MAEGGFDPCECICSHEYAMRRLINLVSSKTEQIFFRVTFKTETQRWLKVFGVNIGIKSNITELLQLVRKVKVIMEEK